MFGQIKQGSFIFEPGRISDLKNYSMCAVVVIEMDDGNCFIVNLEKKTHWSIYHVTALKNGQLPNRWASKKVIRDLNEKILEFPRFRMLFNLF